MVDGQIVLEHDQSVALFIKGTAGGAAGDAKQTGLNAVFNEALDDQTKKLFIIVSYAQNANIFKNIYYYYVFCLPLVLRSQGTYKDWFKNFSLEQEI